MPRDNVLADPLTDFLLMTLPMIKRTTNGEKRGRVRLLWAEVARGAACRAVGTDVSGLPKDRRMAAIACVRAAIDLAHRMGVTRLELVEFFNLLGEQGQGVPPPEDETIERLLGFVLAFAAQSVVDRAGETAERVA